MASWLYTVPTAIPGKLLWSTKGHAAAVESLAFSPDRRLLASGSVDGTGSLWDFGSSKPRAWSVFNKPGLCYRSLAFSPNRRLLATGSTAGQILLFDVVEKTSREIRLLRGGPGAVNGLTFSPDGKLLAGGGDDQTLRVWEPGATSGVEARILLPGHTRPIAALAFGTSGQSVATAGRDSAARVWSLGSIRPNLRMLLPARSEVLTVAFSADGKTLATGLQDGAVLLWDLTATKPTVQAELSGHKGGTRLMVFTTEGETLVSVGANSQVTAWNVRNRNAQSTWDLPSASCPSLALTPDGRYLARGLADGTVEVFRVADKRRDNPA